MSRSLPIISRVLLNEAKANDSVNELWWDETTKIKHMDDKHLKNSALKIMGFSNEAYINTEEVKQLWLEALKIEWNKRLNKSKGIEHGRTVY